MKYRIQTTLTILLALALPTVAVAENIPDKEIANAVVSRCEIDPIVPAGAVQVSVETGVATLTGTVPTLLAKDQAGEIALSTRGIVSVVNRVAVKAIERPDSELLADVRLALLAEPATEHFEIVVEVVDGAVVLHGTVESLLESRMAARAAGAIRGVSSVENDLKIVAREERADWEIQKEVRRALDTDVWITGEFVKAEVEKGVVTLDGVVGSAVEKGRAMERASVAGAVNVVAERLLVDPFVKNPAVKATRERLLLKPEEVREAIETAIEIDPRVQARDLGVDVRGDRTVVLSGGLDNARAKRAAGQVAEDTLGVKEVKNFLKIAGGEPVADSEIVTRAEAAFGRSAYLAERSDLTVAASDGNVTLRGKVQFPFEADLAEDLVLGLRGVVGVENLLKVDRSLNSYRPHLELGRGYANLGYKYLLRQEKLEEAEIVSGVKEELKWIPGIDASEIEVTLAERTIVLEGTVPSTALSISVAEAAHVRSGLKIDNKLRVE